jgi:uncharacterized protein
MTAAGWVNASLLLLTAFGLSKFVIVFINYLSALKLSYRVLRNLSIAHDFTLLTLVPVLFVVFGLTGPQLLLGSTSILEIWQQGNAASSIAVLSALNGIAVLGIAWWIRDALRHQLYRLPRQTKRVSQNRLDLIQLLSQDLDASGPERWLARLPGNEQFQLDIQTLECSFPELPPECAGVTIAHLSDLHFRGAVDLTYFRAVFAEVSRLKADLVVFTGDLLDEIERLDWLTETFGQVNAPLGKFFVLGNHDWYAGADTIRPELAKLGWQDATRGPFRIERGNSAIELVGTEWPWMGVRPQLSPRQDNTFRLLLSHGPDEIAWAQQNYVQLMLAGHTHGGQIRLPVLGPVFSPSRYDVRFSAGTFYQAPTLLHVSRGISGKDPIRYRCSPELTLFRLVNA